MERVETPQRYNEIKKPSAYRVNKKIAKKVSQQMYFILPATNKTGPIFPAKYPLQNSSLGAPNGYQ